MTQAHQHNQLCRDLFARLSEYLDNELDPTDNQAIERHLADCDACQTCLSTLRRTMELCRDADPLPMPEQMSDRLKSLIDRLLDS